MKRGAFRAALARRARWLAPLLAVAVAVGVLLLDAESGVSALLGLRTRVDRAESHVGAAEARRAELYERIGALRRDDLAVETAAREQLGMLRNGELVLRWVPPSAESPAAEPPVPAQD